MSGKYFKVLYYNNNYERRYIQRKKHEIRRKLRDWGYLPKYGEKMSTEQEKIWTQIREGDFSFYDSVKKRKTTSVTMTHPNYQKRKVYTPEEMILLRAKQNAKDRKLEFNLDITDIVIPEVCPYLQIPMTVDFEHRYSPHYFTIDRIDSTKGYIKGNVQIISRMANTMKNNATVNELVVFSQSVLQMYEAANHASRGSGAKNS